jgi:spore maturation protein CgeB
VNCHIDLAGEYADNMRLFEAPGMGALLVTDWKVNLGEIYRVGDEVVAYRTPDECLELVEYYLTHEDERAAIARAGQARTLREHTYAHRAQELEKIMADFV